MARPKMKILPEHAVKIKAICKYLGITQKELGKAIGISEQTISLIARGKTALTPMVAVRINKAFPEILKAFPEILKEWLPVGDFQTVDVDLCAEAVEHFGSAHQMLKAAEEYFEVGHAILRYMQAVWRCDPDAIEKARRAIQYERADAYIVDQQLDMILSPVPRRMIQEKQERLRILISTTGSWMEGMGSHVE